MIKLMDLYNTKPVFKEFVDKYMRCHGIKFVDRALKCMAVKNYAEYLLNQR